MNAQREAEFTEYLEELTEDFAIPVIQPDSLDMKSSLLLDIREKEEFDVSHIQNAVWTGYDDFNDAVLDAIPKDTTIVVYCSVGYRSSKIAVELKKQGFSNVFNLYGGIFKWANQGRDLYTNQKKSNKLHAYNKKWGRFVTNPSINKIY